MISPSPSTSSPASTMTINPHPSTTVAIAGIARTYIAILLVYLLYYLLIVKIQRDRFGEVGRPYKASCTAYTSKAVNSDYVNISWIGPDGVIANDSSRITVIPTTSTSERYNHTSTLQFSYISEEDENTSYNCTASLSSGDHEPLSKSFTMNILTCKLACPALAIHLRNQVHYYHSKNTALSYMRRHNAAIFMAK